MPEVGLRVSPWPNDHLCSVAAQLAPVPGRRLPPPDAIRAIAQDLGDDGYEQAITVALAPIEQGPFLDAGFVLHERLHLLTHDLHAVPSRIAPKPRRPRHDDWDDITTTDSAAFSEFWRLGREGMAQAMAATPVRRLRVVDHPESGVVVGYVLTGRAGPTGYLQRLAVQPEMQGRGLGRAMLIDSLHWLRRHRAERALVNTQVTNERAFRLYSSVGFVPDPGGLAVLKLPLTAGVPE
jgi:ribosomal protein S18 acetylase RimI-like enzyme